MKEIKFSKDHIKKIKKGRKISTLRTVRKNNLYPINGKVKINGTDLEIKIETRLLIRIKEDGVEKFELSGFVPRKGYLAEKEGFDSYGALIQWFKRRNYNIPQVFFNYWFDLV